MANKKQPKNSVFAVLALIVVGVVFYLGYINGVGNVFSDQDLDQPEIDLTENGRGQSPPHTD